MKTEFEYKTLAKIRSDLDLSQFELSKRSGVGRNKITLVENGYADFNEIELKQISAAITERHLELLEKYRSHQLSLTSSVE